MKTEQSSSEPAVSILVLTYNHAPYIRECLDSLLVQETDFPFEIVIGEDGSSDGTREICLEYAERHPGITNLVLHSRAAPERAEYVSQGNYNYIAALKHCGGKYIADIDGDDYWTDPHKLQKQYDMLESDPSLVLVHSDYDNVNQDSTVREKKCHAVHGGAAVVQEDPKAFLFDVLMNAYHIRTCTVVMRTSAIDEALAACGEDLKKVPMADVPMWCEVLRHGKAGFLPDSTAAYRSLEESACNSDNPLTKARFVNRAADWGMLFGERCGLPMQRIVEHKIKTANRYALLSGDYAEMRKLYRAHAAQFSAAEKGVYLAGRIWPLRKVLQWKYFRTYRKTQKAKINECA